MNTVEQLQIKMEENRKQLKTFEDTLKQTRDEKNYWKRILRNLGDNNISLTEKLYAEHAGVTAFYTIADIAEFEVNQKEDDIRLYEQRIKDVKEEIKKYEKALGILQTLNIPQDEETV